MNSRAASSAGYDAVVDVLALPVAALSAPSSLGWSEPLLWLPRISRSDYSSSTIVASSMTRVSWCWCRSRARTCLPSPQDRGGTPAESCARRSGKLRSARLRADCEVTGECTPAGEVEITQQSVVELILRLEEEGVMVVVRTDEMA